MAAIFASTFMLSWRIYQPPTKTKHFPVALLACMLSRYVFFALSSTPESINGRTNQIFPFTSPSK